MLKCELYAYSTSPHVSQLYTGFSTLARKGEIRLVQKIRGHPHYGWAPTPQERPHEFHGLFAVVNDEKVLFYDTKDSPDLYLEAADRADAYFKRSYSHSAIPVQFRSKVFPLGMNYELYAGGFDRHELARVLIQCLANRTPRRLALSVAGSASLCFSPKSTNMCGPPTPRQEPRVLFMVRAWNPDDDPPGLSREQREERASINETRARCVWLLRREFGRRFLGGFAHTDYAVRNLKGLLMEDGRRCRKRSYVSLLRSHPVCVATSGLHGSIGWKLGEYVAFSRAIVSERLSHSTPGSFENGKNYLEFDTPEQCVRQAVRLCEDERLRREMMQNNWDYYSTYLVADRMVLRTLQMPASVRHSERNEVHAPTQWSGFAHPAST